MVALWGFLVAAAGSNSEQPGAAWSSPRELRRIRHALEYFWASLGPGRGRGRSREKQGEAERSRGEQGGAGRSREEQIGAAERSREEQGGAARSRTVPVHLLRR